MRALLEARVGVPLRAKAAPRPAAGIGSGVNEGPPFTYMGSAPAASGPRLRRGGFMRYLMFNLKNFVKARGPYLA
jgi:hypothetical protein